MQQYTVMQHWCYLHLIGGQGWCCFHATCANVPSHMGERALGCMMLFGRQKRA